MGHEEIQKIVCLFFEEPNRNFQIREIARITRIPKTTVQRHILRLVKEDIVVKRRETVFPSYRANEESPLYKRAKRMLLISNLYDSGLMDHLEKLLIPKCIILFGSGAKGEYTKDSDIDIFIQASEKDIHLEKYEKIMKHRITLFFEPDISRLSNELLNNIINGYKLSGYLKIK